MFPTSTPSTSSKRENYPTSTPLNQVYSHEQLLNTNTNSNINNVNNFTGSNPAPPPPTTVRTYKTRERLYYETDYVKATNSPINTAETSNNSSNSALFEPFMRKQSGANVEEVNNEELPPTASLHDNTAFGTTTTTTTSTTTAANAFSSLCTGSPMVINGVIGSPMKTNTNLPNLESSQFAPTQWSSVFVSGGQEQMTRSITIFGFPPNCRNEILLSFQSHGKIESFDGSEGNNWIHIVYESEWSAQKALNRNGSIFQSTGSMIGVIPMQTALEKVNNAADTFMSPIKKKTSNEVPSIFLKKEKKSDEIDVSSLPNDSSLVTKAVNYIFGW